MSLISSIVGQYSGARRGSNTDTPTSNTGSRNSRTSRSASTPPATIGRAAHAAPDTGYQPYPGYGQGASTPESRGVSGGGPSGSQSSTATAATPVASPGWTPQMEARFARMNLAPADMRILATAGLTEQELNLVAAELEKHPEYIAPASPGSSQGSGSSTAGVSAYPAPRGSSMPTGGGDPYGMPVGSDIPPYGYDPKSQGPAGGSMGPYGPDAAYGAYGVDQMPGQSAWSPQWEAKFAEALTLMGLKEADIEGQLSQIRNQPLPEEQIASVYDEMKKSMGAWDQEWFNRFNSLFDELKVPEEHRAQAIPGLASQGATDQELQKIYDDIEGQMKPGWTPEMENRFKTLDLPDGVLNALRESEMPAAALEEQFNKMREVREEYRSNGRLDDLKDAGASPEDLWGDGKEKGGILLQEMQVKADTGKGISDDDFDKMKDALQSSNVPLWKRGLSIAANFIPGVGTFNYIIGKDFITGEKIDRTNPLNIGMAVLSAIPAIGWAKGGIQAIRGAGMLTGALKAGTAGTATMQAVEAAGLASKFTQGLGVLDKLKMVTPLVNRFGEANKLYGLSRGFYSGQKFLSAAGAMRLANGNPAYSQGQLARMADNYAFTQAPGQLGHIMNPFKNRGAIDATRVAGDAGRYTQISLGHAARVSSPSGVAAIRGAADGAGRSMMNGAQTTAAGFVNQGIATEAARLGIAPGGAYRTLGQLFGPGTNQQVMRALAGKPGVQNAILNSMILGGAVSLPVVGTATGQFGRQYQTLKDQTDLQNSLSRQYEEARPDQGEISTDASAPAGSGSISTDPTAAAEPGLAPGSNPVADPTGTGMPSGSDPYGTATDPYDQSVTPGAMPGEPYPQTSPTPYNDAGAAMDDPYGAYPTYDTAAVPSPDPYVNAGSAAGDGGISEPTDNPAYSDTPAFEGEPSDQTDAGFDPFVASEVPDDYALAGPSDHVGY